MFRLIVILVISVVGCSCTPRMIGNPGYDSLRQAAIDQAWKTFNTCLAKLTIEVIDNTSRTPVSARVVIHPIKGMNFAELQEKSIQPLHQDTQLIDFFTDYMAQYKEQYVGGFRDFQFETNGHLEVLVNYQAQYLIQTFHPEYQYTSNIITIKSKHLRKKIQLQDKGITVQIDFQQ